jgi:hypothetical protein
VYKCLMESDVESRVKIAPFYARNLYSQGKPEDGRSVYDRVIGDRLCNIKDSKCGVL